ncbi:MAG: hypothetical protein DWQ05_07715 [Calditrichaeota bacterium]|nr:MAG: hypothetical protein DWQ05_07715 [Calditrichota bacterium]
MKSAEKRPQIVFTIKNQRGSLSITSLWTLAILSILAIGLAKNTIMGLRLDSYSLRANESAWLARAGIYHTVAILLDDVQDDSTKFYHSFSDDWANNKSFFKKVPCGDGFFEIAYTCEGDYGNISYFYGIQDENRKININKVPVSILQNLPGMNQEKLASLLDWRDRNDDKEPGGAEQDYYQRLPFPYICKNGEIDFLEELGLVQGISAEDVQSWRSLITIYGSGSVNINTASVEVFVTLGIPEELANKIVEFRWGKDAIPSTDDDNIFRNGRDIATNLSKNMKLQQEEQVLIQQLAGELLLDVQSSHFRIQSVGLTKNLAVNYKIKAVVERTSSKSIEIVHWQEGE